MRNMLRSDQMSLCQLFIPAEAAYFVIAELGEIGIVHFKDLNKNITAFQRNYVSDIRRCHEMERKLHYIQSEIGKIPMSDDEKKIIILEPSKTVTPNEINNLEVHISKTEEEIKKLTQNISNLKSSTLELHELQYVLEKAENFLKKRDDYILPIMHQIHFITGVISREKVAIFETVLWRISKGNVLFEQIEIETPLEDLNTGVSSYKTVFVICFQGQSLQSRINKICEGFDASVYSCPESAMERVKLLKNITNRLEEVNLVLRQSYDYRSSFLLRVEKDLKKWILMVTKIKAIYHILNFLNFDDTGKSLIGECWIPTKYIPLVKKALSDGSRASGCSVFSFLYVVKSEEKPPTFHKTNKFTKSFQKIIDLYGIASYQEINPALYSMVTFPFLFGVMFGDVGHATILTIFAIFLIIQETKLGSKKIGNEIFRLVFEGRYLLLLIGLFSLYTGLIYNEIFSKSMNIFGSSWYVTNNKTLKVNFMGTPYIFGIDPIWSISSNRIIFLNSFKMKLSIIYGVAHMILGLCLKVANFIYFKKISNVFLEFIPQLLLLCTIFLWLVIMMFIKWTIYSAETENFKKGASCAPSILLLFINMMLMKETIPTRKCDAYLFTFQPKLEKILLFVAAISIPTLLLGKPLYLKLASLKNYRDKTREENKNFSELLIMQIIHTIEYVLSTVSHTASYLRLWALSLAHAELSTILWNRVLLFGLKWPGFKGALILFISFFCWVFFTVSILIIMEGLSVFLHTLRLHWVEFMSKFYIGEGYLFQPFNFQDIIKKGEIDFDENVEESDDISVKSAKDDENI